MTTDKLNYALQLKNELEQTNYEIDVINKFFDGQIMHKTAVLNSGILDDSRTRLLIDDFLKRSKELLELQRDDLERKFKGI